MRIGATGPAPQETTILPSPADFADSLENIVQTINGVNAFRVNTHGRLFVRVPAGTTRLRVYLAFNAAAPPASVTYQIQVPVYVDGVFATSYQPNADVIDFFDVALDGAAAHTVEVWNGYEVFLQGTYVYAVAGKGIALGTAPAVNLAVVEYGDSISCGGLSSQPGELGHFALLRNHLRGTGRAALEAFGGRQLWDDAGTGSGQRGLGSISNLAARLVGLAAGAVTRKIWLAIGINDFLVGNWTAAAFGAAYAQLLDDIHTLDAGAHVWAESMLLTGSFEASLPPWRAEVATAASGRPWVTYEDGTQFISGVTVLVDGIHPNDVGHQGIGLGTGGGAGTLNMKTEMGI